MLGQSIAPLQVFQLIYEPLLQHVLEAGRDPLDVEGPQGIPACRLAHRGAQVVVLDELAGGGDQRLVAVG